MDATRTAFDLLKGGDIENLLRLLSSQPSIADERDPSGVSLPMHALYRGQRDLANAIAAKKVTIDVFESAALGRTQQLSECLRNGDEAHSYSADGFTALHFACYFGQPEAARLLIEKGAAVESVARNPTQVMPLHSAASARNLEAVRLLLEHGAPVNARQQNGWTPIHAAAQNGDRAMVELLLRHGADPNASNDQGKTALSLAREKGHQEIASLLEKQSVSD